MSENLDDYPALKKEIEKKKTKSIALSYVDEDEAKRIEAGIIRQEEMDEEEMESKADPYRFAGYDPNAIDFIRRCDTKKEAHEIIDFLEKKGELSSDQAQKLRDQLEKKGLRSFGEKKEEGFYFHQSIGA